MKADLISKAVRYALMASAATALAAPAVFAQDAAQSSTNTQNQNNTAQLGKIEVTGTRIKRTDVETAQPVTIITQAQIRATGLTAIGDVLQQITAAGAAINTQVNNGGSGATFADLRNLGTNRLLVLVNGQRVAPNLAGGVDLNNIPVSIVDHIEILQDGASAIYGSDAIGGVINIITVKNYNGAEASAYLGMYDGKNDGGGWDGKIQEYEFTIGSSGDQSGVVLNVSYVNQSPVYAGNRTISKEPVFGGGTSSGSSGTAAGRFFIGIPKGTTCPAGVTTNINANSTTCDMSLINPGTSTPSLSNFRDFQNSDHFNYAPLNYLVTPNERTGLYVQGHYDLADNLTFNTMAIYNNRVSAQQLAPSPLFLGRSGTSSNSSGQPIVISGLNPYNPFGVDLTGGSSSQPCMVAKPNTCDVLQFLGRRPLELGNRVFQQDVDHFAFRGGFSGYFNMLGNEWDWDLGYNYGKNYESDVTNGILNTARLQEALGEPGQAPCTVNGLPVSASLHCVPFNIFGGYNLATGQGSITPAMANYVLFEAHDVTAETMRDYNANITGNLFNLPAGPVGLALGVESLGYDAFFHPEALTQEGDTSGNVVQSSNGRESTKAEYIEFNIPLVTDVPFMKNVSLDIADRWSQFKWAGGNLGAPGTGVQHSAANASGRAALRWQATDALLLRGSWSQGFRIPSVSEFFLGNSDSFPSLRDPCVVNGGAGTVPGFCQPGDKQPNAQIKTSIGGNANMTPERSISRTVGFVYSPDWLPGFDFSADYYKIELLNAVSVIGGQTILNGCYYGGNLNYCNLITRAGGTQGNYNASGSITDILNVNRNVGGLKVEGVDVVTDYKFPSTSIGDFKAGLSVTFVKQYVPSLPFGQGALSSQEEAGTTSTAPISIGTGSANEIYPKQKATFTLNWNYGDWSAVWNIYFISHAIEDCNALNGLAPAVAPQLIATRCSTQSFSFPYDSSAVVPVNHIGATTDHDVAVTYHVEPINTDFTFGIRNLFDKEPPIVMSAFANSMLDQYRIPGRFFYARVGVKF